MTNAEGRLEVCIDKLYGAVAAPETLLDAIRTVRTTFGASGATHLHFSASGELIRLVDDGHDPAAQRAYIEHYASIDPTRSLLQLRAGEWLWDDRLLDPRHTTEPEFVNDFAPHIGMRYFMGCKLFEGQDGIASFSLQRGQDAPAFDAETFALMRELQPHLKRVFKLLLDVAPAMPAISAAGAAIDMLDMPVCVVDRACRIVYANRAAERLFSQLGSLAVSHGRLRFTKREANDMLQRAVLLATAVPRQASSFATPPESSAMARLQVRAIPLAPHFPLAYGGADDLVLLFMASGSAPLAPAELMQMFGLTQAEADLVVLLAAGATTETCAARRHVSILTIRTQLRAIYSKTGAASQAQLVSMVSALPRLLD